jgi:hypothetical protein
MMTTAGSAMARIIFVLRRAHFSYHRSTVEALARHGVELRLFVDGADDEIGGAQSDAFTEWKRARPEIPQHPLPLRRDLLRRPLMFFRELRSYNNYCNRPDDFEYYRDRWSYCMKLKPSVRQWLASPQGREFAGSVLVRKMTTAVEAFAPSSRVIKNWLRRENPAIVVVTPGNLRHSEDIEVLKAAKALGIKTVVPILSWDNTSTKGLFHIQPNLFLTWNDAHREELIKYHGASADRIRITGSPFFDKWFDIVAPPTSRETFLPRLGLDPQRPFVLYLGSSSNIAKDETWFIRELRQAFAGHANERLRAMQILFRPHPANWQIGIPLAEAGIPMWPPVGALPDTDAALGDFRNSMEHAACIVGINTSGMLDAIIYGKPVIAPLIQHYQYTQARAEHFNRMLEENAIYVAEDADDVVRRVSEVLEAKDPLAANRRAFISRFVRPRSVTAGEAQADEILSLLSYKTPRRS